MEKSTAKSLRVLLLEDHADSASVMLRILRILGHAPTHVTTVADAVQATDADAYDLVISDVGLPDGSGTEFLARARFKKPTPAIAVSGYGAEEDVKQSLQAGFVVHLTKPLNLEALNRAIDDIAG